MIGTMHCTLYIGIILNRKEQTCQSGTNQDLVNLLYLVKLSQFPQIVSLLNMVNRQSNFYIVH